MSEFVGRQRELSLMDSAVQPGQVLALIGPSGVGKTALAHQWLDAAERTGHAHVVDCRGRGPAATAIAISVSMGSESNSRVSEAELWTRAASSLEDFDTLLLDDANFDLAELAVLRRNWHGAVIVTRQRPPEGDAVHVLPVEPLSVPGGGDVLDSDAGQLFATIARASDLRFDASSEADTIADILAACDGFPLAIVLAARQSATLSCERVKRLLEEGRAPEDTSQPPRHHSMQAALRFSWEQLDGAQRRRLYAMSLFATEMSPETVAALCDESPTEASAGLHELVQMGMISRGPGQRPLESLATFARSAYPEDNPEQAAQVKHRLAELAASTASRRQAQLAELYEFGDEAQLWDVALATPDLLDDDALGPVLACWTRWITLGMTAPRRRKRLASVEGLYERAQSWHAWHELVSLYLCERDGRILECLEHARDAATTPEQLHETLVYTAGVHRQMCRNAEARRTLDLAAEQAEPTFRYHYFNAELLIFEGKPAEANTELERAESLLDGAEDGRWARIQMLRAELDETARMRQARIEKVRAVHRSQKNVFAEAWCALELAKSLGCDQDDFEPAWSTFEDARELYRSIDLVREIKVVDVEEALVRMHAGHWERALELCIGVERDVKAGDSLPIKVPRLIRAAAQWQLGQTAEAQALWRADRDYWLEASRVDLGGLFDAFDVVMLLDAELLDQAKQRAGRADDQEIRAALDALILLAESDTGDIGQALELWPNLRNVLSDPPGTSVGRRFATRCLQATLPPLLSRVARLESDGEGVLILEGFQAFRAGDGWMDMSSQTTAMTILELLCTRGEPLDFEALGEVLYPDDVITRESLVNRINVQMSKLRRAGLKPYIVKTGDGFVFDGEFTIG